MNHRQFASALGCAVAVIAYAPPVAAQSGDRRGYDLPAQPLGDALRALALQSGRNILVADELAAGRRSPALKGVYSFDQALQALLAGSGLRARSAGTAILVEADPSDAASAPSPDILITGSRIRNAPVASPVIRLDQRTIRDGGQSTVAEAVRTIPQNFGGGQNPGVGNNVPATSGVNRAPAPAI